MNENLVLLLPVFLPVLFGLLLLLLRKRMGHAQITVYVLAALGLTAIPVLCVLFSGDMQYTLFSFLDSIPVFFHIDGLGRFFSALVLLVFASCGIFSFFYFKEEENTQALGRYYGFFLIVLGILFALDYSGNMITFYLFYELMTLVSFPLIIHSLTKEAIMAGLKYLFYSLTGAYLVLFGIYFLNQYSKNLTFEAGASLLGSFPASQTGFLLLCVFFMILGFSAKAGMFPLHAWLPTAHPAAPAPASALLSSIIVKSGILGMIRVIFYLVGADFIRGTWVQTVFMSLALLTIFMGSVLACREPVLKKRLAYSTVSQVSYILFGLSLLSPDGLTGSMLHIVFHALAKATLFLAAGTFIHETGKTHAADFKGIGRKLPFTLSCYSFASLSLVGIPPMGGFLSKWYLGSASLSSALSPFSWLGPLVLIISALLTAGYLFPVSIHGFWGNTSRVDTSQDRLPAPEIPAPVTQKKETVCMVIPLLLLTGCSIFLGFFPEYFPGYFPHSLVSFLQSLGKIFF